MAKYCSKCGRALPEGVEMCPECHAPGSSDKGAALFTQMTAETEVWKEPEQAGKKRKKLPRKPARREKALMYTGAVLLVAITAFIILFTQPSAKVKRAIKAGEYDKAISVYSDRLLGKSSGADRSIGVLLEETAGKQCSAFELGEADAQSVESVFASLYAFGLNTDGIDRQYERFYALKETQDTLDEGERLIISERFLDACEVFLSIPQEDGQYEKAQSRAAECLDMYSASVLSQAENYMAENDYRAAVKVLERGNDMLKEYGTYSAYIDAKLEDCFDRYEAYALEEAENLAGLSEYSGAVNLIMACINTVGETDELSNAFDKYSALDQEQTAADAISRANEFYADGQYADAFLELEAAKRRLANAEDLDGAIASFEDRFVSDVERQAKELLAGDRQNIDKVIEFLNSALDIRHLAEIEEFSARVEQLRPLELTAADYSERQGDIFRNSGEFKSVNGTSYTEGWIWGGNGDSISFKLDGSYDAFEGTFAVRRDDGKNVSAYFQVWCDGELKYTSETLSHNGGDNVFSYDISGCRELKIMFFCDYETSTASNGYCYHGICSPAVIKSMED